MATKPNIQVAKQLTGPQHYVPPTARELRAQAVRRLQGGLCGLAAMLLLIGLANIIMDRARLAEAASGIVDQASSPAATNGPASDPLADAGVVVPAASPAPSAQPANGPALK